MKNNDNVIKDIVIKIQSEEIKLLRENSENLQIDFRNFDKLTEYYKEGSKKMAKKKEITDNIRKLNKKLSEIEKSEPLLNQVQRILTNEHIMKSYKEYVENIKDESKRTIAQKYIEEINMIAGLYNADKKNGGAENDRNRIQDTAEKSNEENWAE